MHTVNEKVKYIRTVLIAVFGQDGDKTMCLSCPPGCLQPYQPCPDVSDIGAILAQMKSDQEAGKRFEQRYRTPIYQALLRIGLGHKAAEKFTDQTRRDCIYRKRIPGISEKHSLIAKPFLAAFPVGYK